MKIVGFDRTTFMPDTRTPQAEAKSHRHRAMMRCKCSKRYELGKYTQHVRNSTHSSHAKDKSLMVDMNGKKHQPCYAR
jgi:hypothetical protein